MNGSDALEVGREVLTTEAQALLRMSRELGPSFVRAVEVFAAITGRVVCVGVGKSGHVGRKIAATFASTGSPAIFVHATEASHGDLGMIGSDDAVLALSKSGETRELADVVAYAKRFGIPLVAITAVADSALGRAADVRLLIPDALEAAGSVDAPTTSTTLQIALGDALAVALMQGRGFTPRDFGAFHPGGKLGAALRTVDDLMHSGDALPVVAGETAMTQALLVITEKRLGVAGVTGPGGELIGVITDGDLRRHMNTLTRRSAAEVMSRQPKTIAKGALAAEALKLMHDNRITTLFVVAQGRPVGVLHVHDLLRAGVA